MSTIYTGTPIPGLGSTGPGLGPLPATQAKMEKLVQLQAFKNSAVWLTFTFLINPQSYQQTELARAQVLQTLGGGFADLFGPALVQIQFSGTTGLQQTQVNGLTTDGYERFQDLCNFIRQMWSAPISDLTDDYEFYLYNWTDDQFYQILPLQNTWTMAVPQQLVFYYQLQAVGLRQMNAPSSIAPYAIQNWFLNSQAASVAASASSAAVAAALSYQLMEPQDTALAGVPQYVQSLILTDQSIQAQQMAAILSGLALPTDFAQALAQPLGVTSYLPYLSVSDYPSDEFYPGAASITAAIAAQLPDLFTSLAALSQGGSIPYATSYGALQSITADLQTQLQYLEALPTVPAVFDSQFGAVVDGLESILLFPTTMQP